MKGKKTGPVPQKKVVGNHPRRHFICFNQPESQDAHTDRQKGDGHSNRLLVIIPAFPPPLALLVQVPKMCIPLIFSLLGWTNCTLCFGVIYKVIHLNNHRHHYHGQQDGDRDDQPDADAAIWLFGLLASSISSYFSKWTCLFIRVYLNDTRSWAHLHLPASCCVHTATTGRQRKDFSHFFNYL